MELVIAKNTWASGPKIALAVILLSVMALAQADDELHRRAITKVAPLYPAIARRSSMNITGTVKVHVVVAKDGSIKESKVVGGHPLLVNAAMDALKKWKFEPADEESTGTVEFKFAPE
ncbi:MAG TPA: energy transducer TonB [Terriglobales bacterium]